MQLIPHDRVSANSNAYNSSLLVFHAISGKSVNESGKNLEIRVFQEKICFIFHVKLFGISAARRSEDMSELSDDQRKVFDIVEKEKNCRKGECQWRLFLSPLATTGLAVAKIGETTLHSRREEIFPRTTLNSSCQGSRFTEMKIMPNSSYGRSFYSRFVVVREARLY